MAGPCGGDRAADPSDQFTGISRASCELRPQLRCGRGASICWNQNGVPSAGSRYAVSDVRDAGRLDDSELLELGVGDPVEQALAVAEQDR